MKTLLRQLWVPAAWLAWCLLVVWAYLPALDGPAQREQLRHLPSLEQVIEPAGFPSHLLGPELDSSEWLATPGSQGVAVFWVAQSGERKRTGLILHLLSGVVVLLLARRLFASAAYPGATGNALAVAALWISLPLLLSSVVHTGYLMFMVSHLFVLLALWGYSEVRASPGSRGWMFLFVVSAVLASLLGGMLLTFSAVMLLELLIFRFGGLGLASNRLVYAGLAIIALVLVIPLFLLPGRFLEGYDLVAASPATRALAGVGYTLDYARQILWVDTSRLGLYHDDAGIAASLWRTLSAGASLLVLLLLVFSAITGRARLVALGLSLFLVGEVIGGLREPAELYLEQRNYLPSLGLLLALVAAVAGLQKRMPVLRGWPVLVVVLLLGRQLVLLGSQAVIWSDDYLLHLESENGQPDSQRTRLELAFRLASDGNLVGAKRRAAIGTQSWSPAKRVMLDALFYCAAREPFPQGHFASLNPDDPALAELPGSLLAAQVSRRMLSGQCAEGDEARFVAALGVDSTGIPVTRP